MGSMRILPISHPFPSTLQYSSSKLSSNTCLSLRTSPRLRAAGDDSTSDGGADQEEQAPIDAPASTDDPFDSRLAQVRFKYRSGTGKKAEQRRQRRGKPGTAGNKQGSLLLPPVPLREPTAGGGVKVEVGFTPYSERINGAMAGLGLAALLLVELGSGKGLLSFHAPSVLFLQIYTVAALGAVFVKWEKERISVWPDKAPQRPDAAAPSVGE